MKVGAMTTAYNEEKIIRATLRCLKPFVHRHVVMVSDRPFNGTPEPPDKTREICEEEGCEVINGVWKEHEQRNIGNSFFFDCDWILQFDADELMTKEDLGKFIKYLETCPKPAVAIISKVYWRTTDFCFSPDPDHHKIIAIKPFVKCWQNACIDKEYHLLKRDNEIGITHHHLSYCEPKDILSKVRHYVHANEFNGEEWYEKHYKNWKQGEPVYQPFMTKWEAKYDPLPEELKQLL